MTKMQTMVVMRHAMRLDEVDTSFVSSSTSWWDPPLADEGLRQVAAVIPALRACGLQVLISSPFRRCLQTAHALSAAVLEAEGTLHIDCSLCELLTPRNLNFVERAAPEGHIQDWMWKGASLAEALHVMFPQDDHIIDDSKLPEYPETAEDAHARMNAALEAIGNRYEGKNILIVSHGEAINRSIMRLMPLATVIDAQHCCFSVARRVQDADGDWEQWELDASKLHNVQALGL